MIQMADQNKTLEVWELWYPKAAAAGMPFSRSRIDPATVLLVHSAPEYLTVEVRTQDGRPVARGEDLKSTADRPMARLTIRGSEIVREDLWPEQQDLGRLVILPGGEVGTLREWWNANDGSEWRWSVEFYNHR